VGREVTARDDPAQVWKGLLAQTIRTNFNVDVVQ
jgi:hypothetical protein